MELTPATAYWIGAVLTDGYFQQGRHRKSHYHRVVLSAIDREMLEAVNEANLELVGREYAIMHRPRKSGSKPFWVMQMTNARLWEWGFQLTHGKQRIPPKLLRADDELRMPLLAGLMDGDGWVSLIGRSIQIGIQASAPWVLDLKRMADSMKLPTSGPKVIHPPPGKPWSTGRRLLFSVRPFVKADVPLRIARKRERLEAWKLRVESSETARSAYADLYLTDRKAYNRENQREFRRRRKIQSGLHGDMQSQAETT